MSKESDIQLMLPHAEIVDRAHYASLSVPVEPHEELLELEQKLFKNMSQFSSFDSIEAFYNELNFGNLFALPESNMYEYIGFEVNMTDLAELVFIRASSIAVCYSAQQYMSQQADSKIRVNRLIKLFKESRKSLLLAFDKEVDAEVLTFEILPTIEDEVIKHDMLKACITMHNSVFNEHHLRHILMQNHSLLPDVVRARGFTVEMFDDLTAVNNAENVDPRVYDLASSRFLDEEKVERLWRHICRLPKFNKQLQSRELVLRAGRNSMSLFSTESIIELTHFFKAVGETDYRVEKQLERAWTSRSVDERKRAYASLLNISESESDIALDLYAQLYEQFVVII